MYGKGDRQLGDKNPMYGKPNPNRKVVLQFDKEGNLIKEYEYLNQVAEDGFHVGNVGGVCNGRGKTSGGYVWKFKD